MQFSYVFILKSPLYVFRRDTPFIISSLHITVYVAVCAYHADSDQLLGLVSWNSSWSSNWSWKHVECKFQNKHTRKLHLVGLFIQLIAIHGLHNIKQIVHDKFHTPRPSILLTEMKPAAKNGSHIFTTISNFTKIMPKNLTWSSTFYNYT